MFCCGFPPISLVFSSLVFQTADYVNTLQGSLTHTRARTRAFVSCQPPGFSHRDRCHSECCTTEGASVVATNRPGTDNAAAVCEFRYTLVWTRKYADCWAAHSPPEIKCVGTTSDWHWWWSSVNLCWKRSRLYYVDLCRDKCVLRSSCHALEYTSYIPVLSILTQWKCMSCFTHWSIVSHFTH